MTDDEFETVAGAMLRKSRGVDCTEDESAVIKRAFDDMPAFNGFARRLAQHFPTEFAEWGEEVERGDRTWNARST